MSTTQPLVTVVVPTLRRPKYLVKTLESVLAQTYASLEVIVSDNGSGDETPQVVARFTDPRMRFRQNVTTVDMPTHLNQCLDEAKGEFFVVLSDDDLISSNFVQSLVDGFAKIPDAMVGLTRCEIIDETGHVSRKMTAPDWEWQPGTQFVFDWLWKGKSVAATFLSMFMRTNLLRSLHGFPDFSGGANTENALLILLGIQGKILFVRKGVFQYRVYSSSYGLSMPHDRLAQSSAEFRDFLVMSPIPSQLLNEIDPKDAGRIRQGVARMLARQYLGRLQQIYFPQMSFIDSLAALMAYRADTEYLRALPRFFMSVFKHKVRSLLLQRKVALR